MICDVAPTEENCGLVGKSVNVRIKLGHTLPVGKKQTLKCINIDTNVVELSAAVHLESVQASERIKVQLQKHSLRPIPVS